MSAQWEAANQRHRHASKARRHLLWKLQCGLCFYCGECVRIGVDATVDHLIPHSMGGRYAMVVACPPCNGLKGDRLPTSQEVFRFIRLLKTAHPHGLKGRAWVGKAIEEVEIVAFYNKGAVVRADDLPGYSAPSE